MKLLDTKVNDSEVSGDGAGQHEIKDSRLDPVGVHGQGLLGVVEAVARIQVLGVAGEGDLDRLGREKKKYFPSYFQSSCRAKFLRDRRRLLFSILSTSKPNANFTYLCILPEPFESLLLIIKCLKPSKHKRVRCISS